MSDDLSPGTRAYLEALKLQQQAGSGHSNVRQQTLDAAKAAVADRGLNYGTSEDNFARIAALWSTHLRNRTMLIDTFEPHDVAIMLALVKIARLENDPTHTDSWVDLAGYAACGAEVAAKKPA